MARSFRDNFDAEQISQIWFKRPQGLRSDLAAARRLLLLTCSIGGLQIIWSTILSNGTPFLISLGFPQSATALVWTIAPFCGAFVQPYFGMLGDQSRNPLGRRRPFMLGGAIVVSASLLCFGFSPAIVRGIVNMLGSNVSEVYTQRLVMTNAVVWFCVLNVALQPLQVGSRALTVEACAVDEQVTAHAWASRVQGISSIAGYFLASMPLPEISFYGPLPQFSTLCLLASLFLLVAVFVSCYFIHEEAPRSLPTIEFSNSNLSAKIKHLISSVQQIPKPIRRICLVQCFAWMAWFPFLAYYTTYIARIYESGSSQSLDVSQETYHSIDQPATPPRPASLRFGSFAGLFLALVAFISTCVLPLIASRMSSSSSSTSDKHPAWHPSHQHDSTSTIPTSTLTLIWTFAHLYFSVAIFALTSLDLLVPSSSSSSSSLHLVTSTVLVASIGVSWAITLWVPYCLVGVELRRFSQAVSSSVFVIEDVEDEEEGSDDREKTFCKKEKTSSAAENEVESKAKTEAGTIMGFHNAAISAPQIISAVISAMVFTATKRGADERFGLEWAMRIAGLWAIGAAVLTWRMGREEDGR